MSLVAYDSSDEGSENEGNESATTIVATNDADNDVTEAITLQTSSKLSLPAPKAQNMNEEEEISDTGDFKQFLDKLPKPRGLSTRGDIEEDDIPLKKEMGGQTVKPPKKQTVKITVPSLSEFKDLEEESEKKPTRTIELPQRDCGLFSVLVPPKEETIKNKILIPRTIKNATVKANIQQSNAARKSSTSQTNDFKEKKFAMDKSYNESSDEDDTVEDFFGLAASKDVSDASVSELVDSELPSSHFTNKSSETLLIKNMEDHTIHNSSTSTLINDQASNSNKTLTSNVMNLPKEEILLKNKAEVGPKLPVPEQEYNVDMEGNIAFDEKAIEYLCGKRGVKRKDKEIDEANIIEINGEDIKPDEREWLVKALTEEQVQRPISMQSCGINSQSKKKHQITYLAHQAKAMELELKNQWSQNKMTRKQTKSKYGF